MDWISAKEILPKKEKRCFDVFLIRMKISGLSLACAAEPGVSGGLGRRGTRWFAYDVDWKAPGCPGAKEKTV